jgi:hypothetical protein
MADASPKFRVMPEHVYHPVQDMSGRIVALCPTSSEAQEVAAALNERFAKKRRSSQHKGNANKENGT